MKDFLCETVRKAGEISLEYRERLEEIEISRKSPKDLVTEADVAVEEFICSQIRQNFPEHSIYGEESGSTAGNEYRWVIDPIDGTTSFVHGQPFYSVSVALEYEGAGLLGAVYLPVTDELFFAEKDCGAFLNGKRIRVSGQSVLQDSVLGTGFACLRSNNEHNNLVYFNRIAPIVRGIRRYGSAAADLCYVGCGRFDGFWELNLKIFDIAAGVLIAREAGAVCCDFQGGDDQVGPELLCANPKLCRELLKIFSEIKKDEK